MTESPSGAVLVLRAGTRTCALAIEHVLETTRPLPVTALPGTPAFVRGLAVVRGRAVPVVDLESFLGGEAAQPVARFVLVRCGERAAALAVAAVLGVRRRGDVPAGAPLLSEACAGAIEEVGALDDQLLLVLRAGRLVPEEVWRAVDRVEAAP